MPIPVAVPRSCPNAPTELSRPLPSPNGFLEWAATRTETPTALFSRPRNRSTTITSPRRANRSTQSLPGRLASPARDQTGSGETSVGPFYDHVLGPNQPSCTNAGGHQNAAWTAASAHRGDVSLLFVDGHCRSIGSGINVSVWRALSSRHGGEVISEGNL